MAAPRRLMRGPPVSLNAAVGTLVGGLILRAAKVTSGKETN